MRKYLNPINYIKYSIRLGKKYFFSFPLTPVEKYLVNKYGEIGISQFPPVFIIGAPRCGSTLLYKLLTDRYKFAFFSNFTAFFYEIPALATLAATKLRIENRRGDFESHYGKVKGLGAPSECGDFYYRWFPADISQAYVAPGAKDIKTLKEFRHSLGAISYLAGTSILTKNLFNSLRIAPIVEAMPEAIFIVCKRHYLDNALEILNSRIILRGQKDCWIGPPPKEINELKRLHYTEQVAGQIYYIYRQIEEDKERYGKEIFLEVKYEDLCDNLNNVLKEIDKFLTYHNCNLEKIGKIPNGFNIRTPTDLGNDDKLLVQLAVKAYFPDQ